MFAGTRKILIATVALALVVLTGSNAQAQFRGDSHLWSSNRHERVHSLARQLENDARVLNRETDTHFRNFPRYRQFEAQVDEIVRAADHIHNVAHRGGSLAHLRNDVVRLDRFYHATERLFDEMVSWRRLDRETVIHVRRALNRVERDIHALRDLVD